MGAMLRGLFAALILTLAASCGESANGGVKKGEAPPTNAIQKGAPNVQVVLGPGAPIEVVEAATELTHTLSQVTGVEFPAPVNEESGSARIVIGVGAAALDDGPVTSPGLNADSYRISSYFKGKTWYLELRAGGPAALQYAIYDLCGRLGARYIHPEQTYYPAANEDFEVPLPIDAFERADLPLRGFAQDTRLPVPFADLLTTPNEELNRPYLENWLQWLVRNRLNVHAFHVLNTTDLATWTPYIAKHVKRAEGLGIEVWPIVSFADDTHNSWRLIQNLDGDHTSQIAAALDQLLAIPFPRLVVRLDSTPLNRPSDPVVVAWIEAARTHLHEAHPGVDLFVQVAGRSDLRAEDEQPFHHLARGAQAGLIARTHMLWDIAGSAPVLGGDDFTHQRDLLLAESGERRLIFSPDSAYWRGFDIDVPLFLPVAALNRTRDLTENLAGVQLHGMVVSARGQEWGYWMWDLFSARAAWDHESSLTVFLGWLRPVIGKQLADVITQVANRQREAFDADPKLLFYLTGERAADEAGGLFGDATRPRAPVMSTLLALPDADWEAWKSTDLVALEAMRDGHAALVGALTEPGKKDGNEFTLTEDETLDERVRKELDSLLRIHALRLDQLVKAYGALVALREPLDDPEAQKNRLDALEDAVDEATDAARKRIGDGEERYRYPSWLLWNLRRDEEGADVPPVVTYPRGYLFDAHNNQYLERRQDELSVALSVPPKGGWSPQPALIFGQAKLTVISPESKESSALFSRLIPPLLLGVNSWPQTADEDVDVTLAADRNADGQPDPGSSLRISDGVHDVGSNTTTLQGSALKTVWYDALGKVVAEVSISPINVTLQPKHVGGALQDVFGGTLTGQLEVETTAQAMAALSGGSVDLSGARELLAVAAGTTVEALPDRIDVAVTLVGFQAL